MVEEYIQLVREIFFNRLRKQSYWSLVKIIRVYDICQRLATEEYYYRQTERESKLKKVYNEYSDLP